jgi:hypothetical protein
MHASPPPRALRLFLRDAVSFKEVRNDCGVEVCSLKRIKEPYDDLSGEGRYVIDGCKMQRTNVHSRKNYLFQQRNCVLN